MIEIEELTQTETLLRQHSESADDLPIAAAAVAVAVVVAAAVAVDDDDSDCWINADSVDAAEDAFDFEPEIEMDAEFLDYLGRPAEIETAATSGSALRQQSC